MTEAGVDVREALATSEALLRTTLEGTQTGSWVWDVGENVVTWSENLGPIHGLPRGAQPVDYAEYIELVHPDDRVLVGDAVAKALADGTGYEIEFRSAPRDGDTRWIWASATVLLNPDGTPARIVGLTRDITPRKRAAERETILADVANAIDRVADPKLLAEEVAQRLVTGFADRCEVELTDGARLAAHATAGAAGDGDLPSRLVADVTARGSVVGTVSVAAGPGAERYDGEDAAFLEEIGLRLGMAVERARLDRAVEVARRDADLASGHAMRLQQVTAGLAAAATMDEIADVIVTHGIPALSATTAILGVLDTPEELRFLRTEGYGGVFPERLRVDDPWPITAAVRSGSLIELADVPEREATYSVPERVWQASGKGTLIAVPLVGTDGPIGALGFTRDQREPLTPQERRLVETLATQTALSLERASLFEANHRARLQAEGLQRVTSAVATAATVEALADAVATEALDILDVEGVTVLLARTPGSTTADVLASRGTVASHARNEPTIPLRAPTVTAQAIRTQTPQFAESLAEIEKRWPASGAVARRLGLGAVACIPIQVGDRVGAVSVVARERRLPDEERTFLRLLARACEHGLVRAALYDAETEARRRSDILHRLASALSSALVPADVASAFLEHALPILGAVSGAVVVADATGSELRTVGVRGAGGEGSQWPVTLPVGSAHVHAAAFRTGVPVAAGDRTTLAQAYPSSATQLGARIEAAYAQPLVAGGATIGAFGFCFDEPRTVHPADERLLLTMARVCAQAIERAHRYESEHAIALRLQRALLPESVAQYPGLQIAARYRAGSEMMEVGGDWYHTFELPDGRVGLSVGDVVGRGIEAAAAMGRLRSALAAFALEETRPGRLISRLDKFATGPGGVEIATASYAVADPVSGVIRWASAGHPPMLAVSPSGETRWLVRGQSPPLGAAIADDAAEAVEVLEPGSLLLAYSDGLVERRGESIDAGLARLEQAARAAAHLSVDEICDRLLDELRNTEDEDDVVLVALRMEAIPGRPFAHSFPASPDEIAICRVALRHWLDHEDVDPRVHADVLLAVHEAFVNAVEHAYGGAHGDVDVTLARDGGDLVAVVRDTGTWRDPTLGDPDRGRGCRLIEVLSATSSILATDAGTTVSMTFRTAEPALAV